MVGLEHKGMPGFGGGGNRTVRAALASFWNLKKKKKNDLTDLMDGGSEGGKEKK